MPQFVFLKGSRRYINPACIVDVEDGINVEVYDPAGQKFRSVHGGMLIHLATSEVSVAGDHLAPNHRTIALHGSDAESMRTYLDQHAGTW